MKKMFDSLAYAQLLVDALPQAIDTKEEFERQLALVEPLHRRLDSLSPEEHALVKLLETLLDNYDHRQAPLPHGEKPHQRLQQLMQASGKTVVDLLPVFRKRKHVKEAVTGKRTISATEARRLGEIFQVNPGHFI